jgi:MOSC domain-containing protein YiiM
MKLLSVNIGREQSLPGRSGKPGQTGIFKHAVDGPVQVNALGLPDDFIADTKHHGGPDQAIYVYGWPDYEWWARELGREMEPGLFGENLTIEGLESAAFDIGDRLLVGPVVLEVTAPRIPCVTLTQIMGIPDFAKRFRFAERPGLYCRVICAGSLQAGDEVRLEKYAGETISILASMRDFYEPQLSEAAIRRTLAAPIDVRSRKHLEEQLQKLAR